MRRLVTTAWFVLLVATFARGDRIILVDGREFEGVVSVEEDSVVIVTKYARLRFAKDKVLRIELKDLPEEELRKRLAAADETDPDALFAVAKWAAQAGLQEEAEGILADVLELDHDHAGARAELGHVLIDNRWYPFEKAVELARSKMAAEQLEQLLTDILPKLQAVAGRKGGLLAVRDLLAHARLRTKRFGAAQKTFAELAEIAEGDHALFYSAIAGILKEHADGMYVLSEAYPPESRLLGGSEPALEAGPASLSNPLVLEAALRDRAKKEIQAGQELMAAAQELESSKPALAHLRYKQASDVFKRADALAEDIARSYRVEVIRRRIAIIRKSCDEEAPKFDAVVRALGNEDLPPRAYRKKIVEMIRQVDNIRTPLKEILVLSKPYPRELVLEVQWAMSDLKKMDAIRGILTDELDGRG